MKFRTGFVTNSSSTAYIIVNRSDKRLYLEDFIRENPQFVQDFNAFYGYEYTQEEMLQCARKRHESFHSGKNNVEYGDNDGDVLGQVLDYILRDGGRSKNFIWTFDEYLR